MKISVVICSVILSICHAVPVRQPGILQDPQRLKPKSADLYEISVDTRPEDGTVKGLRLRRSGDDSMPEISIQETQDGMISVNGIRIRRSDLDDVELDGDSDTAASEVDDSEAAGTDRTRRSGDLFGFFGQALSKKIGSLAAASSGHHAESDLHYGPPVTSYHQKAFDIWAFKKAILSTLLQAVKAIKGGVIALGGQIIKAKGHLITTKGKIVAHKGEAISEFGRHIAANALLTQPGHTGSGATAFAEAAVDHVPSVPTGGYNGATLSSGYGAPSAPSYTSGYPSHAGLQQHAYKRGASANQFQDRNIAAASSPQKSYGHKRSSQDTVSAQSEHKEEILEDGEESSAEERSDYYRY